MARGRNILFQTRDDKFSVSTAADKYDEVLELVNIK